MNPLILAFQTIQVTPVPPNGTGTTVSVTINLEQVLTWIIVGLLAGWLAGTLAGRRRMGFLSSFLLGLLGAVIGGFAWRALGSPTPAQWLVTSGIVIRWIDLIVAFCGAIFVLVLVGALFGIRR